jgi:hypothetical protein
MILLFMACGGGLLGSPGEIDGDASNFDIVWDDTLLMAVNLWQVNQDGSGGVIWGVEAVACEDTIASPLTAGDVPEGTTSSTELALPLDAGNYEAEFYRCIDQGYGDGEQSTPIGTTPFTVGDDGSIEMGSAWSDDS